MLRRRFFILGCSFLSALAFLLYRLYVIQIGDTEQFGLHRVNLIEAARRQQEKIIVTAPVRGQIEDRHGISLLGRPPKGLLLFPHHWKNASFQQWNRLAAALAWPVERLQAAVARLNGPDFLRDLETGRPVYLTASQVSRLLAAALPGAMVAPFPTRYGEDMAAKHVVGYVSQDPAQVERLYREELAQGVITSDVPVGQAGLERAFEVFLQGGIGGQRQRFVITVDGRGNPLLGGYTGLKSTDNDETPLTVRTTIDLDVQRMTEHALDEFGVQKGAAVVLDIANGDILAMASRPDFDPRHVQPTSAAWNNLAVKQTIPGSVFKLVVAAAALEEGLVDADTLFYCDGRWETHHISCWKKDGHGPLTFAEAFAHSCNVAFAQVAVQLGGDKLQQYAARLGLLEPVGWQTERLFKLTDFRQIDGEDPGQLFASGTPHNDGGVLAHTAIGQRDVQITPLQAAYLVAAIARDGSAVAPRLVQSLHYRNGEVLTEFSPQHRGVLPLSPDTIRQLQVLLRKVVEEGTGVALQTARWPLAGKSGTGEYVKGKTDNQWFVGYGPADSPRYAVAVVSIDTPAEEKNKAISVFLHIMDHLAADVVKSNRSEIGETGIRKGEIR